MGREVHNIMGIRVSKKKTKMHENRIPIIILKEINFLLNSRL